MTPRGPESLISLSPHRLFLATHGGSPAHKSGNDPLLTPRMTRFQIRWTARGRSLGSGLLFEMILG